MLTIPTAAICEPTERSILPEILINVTEQEITPTIAAYNPIFRKFFTVRKYGDAIEKITISITRAQITVNNAGIFLPLYLLIIFSTLTSNR